MANIANVTIASDATVKCNGKTFKLADAIKHASALYDNMWLLQEQMLDNYREIGNILIGLQALFSGNDKAFGQYLAGTELGAMSRQDRSDAMFIATNWAKVQKLNTNNALDTLGVSAIRKRLKASEGKASGAGKRKEEQASKPDAEPTVQGVAKVKVQTEDELATMVFDLIQNNGLDFTKFAKALAAKRKGV
jgi:hypothetical protein